MQRNTSHTIIAVFEQLESHYGYLVWWPSQDPFEIMLGSILVQNTNWNNAQKALDNLKPDLKADTILQMDVTDLAQKIRPSGYYNQKALKIKALTQWYANYHFDIQLVREQHFDVLRKQLLAIKGVGGETADVILTYAIGKPSFVIDAYARRIFSRYGMPVPKSYEELRALMQQAIPADTTTYAYYHGLMVEHGQTFCRKKPLCGDCPLSRTCLKVEVKG
ncbi:endonuclease III domain-containing protein [Vibrio gallicus]|uniref:endonuclease III domain-containing protein n=1 Tax=Vibrio gallicus TaxID=190897 RepID=UPI0021C34EC8|nr:endonuclease [Vibrio gallicus]